MKIVRFSQMGLVGNWRFDRGTGTTAKDSSPFGNNGTIYGASWVRGKFGYALKFDGSDDYVDCGKNDSLNLTEKVTMLAYIKTTTSSKCAIVSRRKNALLFINSGKVYVYLYGLSDPGWHAGNTLINDNNWHLIGFTYNKDGGENNLKIYVDGEVDKQITLTGTISLDTDYKVTLGFREEVGDYYDGKIDEVRIYNRALTPEEIKIHFAFTKYIKPHPIIMRRKL